MLPSIKVLVVDDTPLSLHYTQGALRNLGFEEVYSAQHCTEALEVVVRHTIGLVLVGLQMPGMTGLELIARLRSRSDFRTLPVILMTAEEGSSRAEDKGRMKPNAYLVKPFTIAKFGGTITRVLKECGHTVCST